MTSDSPESNRYSPLWFEFFHVGIDARRTDREIDFITRFVPRPKFQDILDACCGMGRHARGLSARGYSVIGVDRDDNAINAARELNGGPRYIHADIRDYRPEINKFDAAIVLGQSFGHFDKRTNESILSRLANSVRKNGRVILDVWNPAFFAVHQDQRELPTSRGNVLEMKQIDGNRLFVQLDYPDGTRENFEWQLFTPEQMQALAERIGLRLVTALSGFEPTNMRSLNDPRLQFVLETS